jgi:hypothetical protein
VASSYEYCYDTSNDSACSGWTSNGTATSIALSGLSLNTTYFWHVRANNSFGTTYSDGSTISFWSFTTGNVPGAFTKTNPANAVSGVSTSPTLSWGASTVASSYEYCYDTSNDNACSGWAGTASTSVTLSGLSINTAYYWHVRAINSFGTTYSNGGSAAFWSFTTGDKPGAFNKNSPANGATSISTSPTLSWGTSTGATGYEYCYDTSDDSACIGWAGTSGTSAALSGLSLNTTYYWHVKAVNSFGATYSNGDSATAFWSFTTGNKPAAFNKTSPANGATGVVIIPTLSWDPSPDATSYDYCYDSSNDSACSGWTSTTKTSVLLIGLSLNTTYYWHVRAINSFGATYSNGDSSSTFWNFTTSQNNYEYYIPYISTMNSGSSIQPGLIYQRGLTRSFLPLMLPIFSMLLGLTRRRRQKIK